MRNSVFLLSLISTVASLAEALRIEPGSGSGGSSPMSLYEAPKTRSGTPWLNAIKRSHNLFKWCTVHTI